MDLRKSTAEEWSSQVTNILLLENTGKRNIGLDWNVKNENFINAEKKPCMKARTVWLTGDVWQIAEQKHDSNYPLMKETRRLTPALTWQTVISGKCASGTPWAGMNDFSDPSVRYIMLHHGRNITQSPFSLIKCNNRRGAEEGIER